MLCSLTRKVNIGFTDNLYSHFFWVRVKQGWAIRIGVVAKSAF